MLPQNESPTAANLDLLMSATPFAVGSAVDSSSKSLMDLLGEILVPSKGSGLPRRLRLTSYSPQADKVTLHAVGPNAQPYESTISQFQKLHRGGMLQREGPPTEGLSLPTLIKRLQDLVGK